MPKLFLSDRPTPDRRHPARIRLSALLAALIVVAACEVMQIPTVAYSPGELEWGSGHAWLSGSEPLSGDSVPVYYHIPETGNPAEFPILIALHGSGRDARAMRDSWRGEADARGFMVFAPEFPSARFPGEDYPLGRVVDEGGELRPRKEWGYQVVEDLFDGIRGWLDSSVADYALYGHGAGGEFAHRLLTVVPEHRARRVLAANSGWYLFPDPEGVYPYGLSLETAAGGHVLDPEGLPGLLAAPLVVLLGEEDADPDDPELKRSDQAMAQGAHRFARGQNYMLSGSRLAFDLNVPFEWTAVTVPGVGHSNQGVIPFAASAVLP
jgi:hypothetical protein